MSTSKREKYFIVQLIVLLTLWLDPRAFVEMQGISVVGCGMYRSVITAQEFLCSSPRRVPELAEKGMKEEVYG